MVANHFSFLQVHSLLQIVKTIKIKCYNFFPFFLTIFFYPIFLPYFVRLDKIVWKKMDKKHDPLCILLVSITNIMMLFCKLFWRVSFIWPFIKGAGGVYMEIFSKSTF